MNRAPDAGSDDAGDARRLWDEWACTPMPDGGIAPATELLQAAQVSALLAVYEQLGNLNDTLRTAR